MRIEDARQIRWRCDIVLEFGQVRLPVTGVGHRARAGSASQVTRPERDNLSDPSRGSRPGPTTTMDEAQTIVQAQQGDLSAFNRLVLAHQGIAFNIAYRIMGDAEAAADVCQDAFLSAFKHLRELRGVSFKSWLLRIVTNACYDELRYRRRRPVSSLEEVTAGSEGDDDPDHSPWLIDSAAGPEEITMNRQLAALIQQGINSLPADQRIIVVLSDVQGMSYQEIADITGIALGTVKSRLSRARARLRDYLAARPELLPSRYRLDSANK